MKIYKLTSNQTDQVYVGKTKDMSRRFTKHKSDYKLWLDDRYIFSSSYFISQYDDVKMEYIEETNNSLREVYWIQKLNTCNFQHNGDDYFIHKLKDKKMRLGFKYCFEIKRNNKRIVAKYSKDLEFLKKFRDEWIKDNQQIFYL
tara:strand:+ start:508 stop:939 length:432 start_codon:yes stop_codon:yes gene_type:complete